MNEFDIKKTLVQAQSARQNPNSFDEDQLRELKKQLHRLAEAQDLSAKDFFLSCLSDPIASWRYLGLNNLGFHYYFTEEKEVCEKIRFLLLNDPDEDVRRCAASVLGCQSEWLDSALLIALHSDSNKYVRIAAFESLLKLAGVPVRVEFREGEKAKNGEIQTTFEEVKRIIAECNINLECCDVTRGKKTGNS